MSPGGPAIRVLLADDHTLLRQGLAGMLRADPGFEVVGEAADGSEAVEQALLTKPDVAVLDISMPRLGGLEATRRIRKALPQTRVLVLTMHEDEEYVLQLVRAGASGYLVKDSAAPELLNALRALKQGRSWFGTQAARALAAAWQGGRQTPEDPYGRLTDREREVFHLLIEGRTNAQVADVLCISPKTVDNHRTRLMEKLDVHSTAEMMRFAARRHLLS
jgi:DNA-binding NarL/FixJ family response regulator